MPAEKAPRRVGGVRPSQLMYSFGVGAVVDLPHFSVVVAGLDDWDETNQAAISEDRLLAAVRAELGPQVRALRGAPWLEETPNKFDDWAYTGVTVLPFPRWLRCTACNLLAPVDSGLFDTDLNAYRPDRARYVHNKHPNYKMAPTAMPARFVVACKAGHLDEFPWNELCHKDQACTGKPILECVDVGSGGRSTDVLVKCRTCSAKQSVSQMFGEGSERVLPQCRGRHPHLRSVAPGGCDQQVVAMLLGASNAWFPVNRSVVSIPSSSDPLDQVVAELWVELEDIDDPAILGYAIKKTPRLAKLGGYPFDDVWKAMEARRAGAAANPEDLDLLGPEWRVLGAPAEAPRGRDFRLAETSPPAGFETRFANTVLVERLREVVALCGFTRVDGPDSGVVSDVGQVQMVRLARQQPAWVPAAEVRGEGLFLRLPEEAVAAWVNAVAGTPRLEALREAHQRWRNRRKLDPAAKWPGERYVLLHSLSHLLINELALECGYGAASIRERIYARDPGNGVAPMAGILLYTAAPDSEGTLGGLVALGDPAMLGRLLGQAVNRARLCTLDPLCAEHTPDEGEDVLHGGACHACLFVPETSCERGNRYLERATVTGTLADAGIEYLTS